MMQAIFSKRKVKRILAFCLFLGLLWQTFTHLTYLFRNSGEERLRFLTFKEETPGSLDAVYIGASSVYVFWDTMYAWDRYGIASYDYATSNMPATLFLPVIKQIQKSMDPQLFIVDIRTFFSDIWSGFVTEGIMNGGGYKNVVDSEDISLERLNCINYTCKMNPSSRNDARYSYVDLAYYHTNTNILANEDNWKFWNNTANGTVSEVSHKGFESSQNIAMFQGFTPISTKRNATLNPESERCFRELLTYCTKQKVPLLVTESPFINDIFYAKETNSFISICEEYGVPFINANTLEHWKEMELDPATDFYNKNHVNVLGAEKYTRFLADYLTKKYELVDHREDSAYESWWEMYKESYLPYIRPLKESARSMIQENREAIENETKMRETDDAVEWLGLANNEHMTLLMAACKPLQYYPSAETVFILDVFGLLPFVKEDKEERNGFIGVYSGHSLYMDMNNTSYEGNTVTPKNKGSGRTVDYSISNDRKVSITVGDEIILDNLQGDIGIVVVDNNLLEVVDIVSLIIRQDGNLSIYHLETEN